MPSTHAPPASTISQQSANEAGTTASIRIRLRPSTNRATGSWATTSAIVSKKKISPIQRSDTPLWFFANTGKSSSGAYPAAMKTTFRPSILSSTRSLTTGAVADVPLDVERLVELGLRHERQHEDHPDERGRVDEEEHR